MSRYIEILEDDDIDVATELGEGEQIDINLSDTEVVLMPDERPLQTKVVNPTREVQKVVADEGYLLGETIVNPIPDEFVDVSDANAIASDLSLGKVAYSSSGRIVGTSKAIGSLETNFEVDISSLRRGMATDTVYITELGDDKFLISSNKSGSGLWHLNLSDGELKQVSTSYYLLSYKFNYKNIWIVSNNDDFVAYNKETSQTLSFGFSNKYVSFFGIGNKIIGVGYNRMGIIDIDTFSYSQKTISFNLNTSSGFWYGYSTTQNYIAVPDSSGKVLLINKSDLSVQTISFGSRIDHIIASDTEDELLLISTSFNGTLSTIDGVNYGAVYYNIATGETIGAYEKVSRAVSQIYKYRENRVSIISAQYGVITFDFQNHSYSSVGYFSLSGGNPAICVRNFVIGYRNSSTPYLSQIVDIEANEVIYENDNTSTCRGGLEKNNKFYFSLTPQQYRSGGGVFELDLSTRVVTNLIELSSGDGTPTEMVEFNDKIYFYGKSNTSVYEYDPQSGLARVLTEPVSCFGHTIVDGELIIWGSTVLNVVTGKERDGIFLSSNNFNGKLSLSIFAFGVADCLNNKYKSLNNINYLGVLNDYVWWIDGDILNFIGGAN